VSVITSELLAFRVKPVSVRLVLPVHTDCPSTMANLLCWMSELLSVTTGMPASTSCW
jgi:hypothetical protein